MPAAGRSEEAAQDTIVRPPLKWAGGKRWQIPHVVPLWAGHRRARLVEPFCGGLAVALSLAPARALLNDVNPHVINFYSWVKQGLRITMPMRNEREMFYDYRDRFNALLTDERSGSADAASLFYYLNRTGYNGLCRFNRSGEFNVPFGRYKTIAYAKDFAPYAARFARWTFTNHDFERVALQPTDFVYADPPYDVPFTAYAKHGFSWDDQVRTAEWLARHRGPVVLSNQATGRIVDLYTSLGYALKLVEAPRMISCTGDRTPAREVIATRNL
jgi:DNA adenine methylase